MYIKRLTHCLILVIVHYSFAMENIQLVMSKQHTIDNTEKNKNKTPINKLININKNGKIAYIDNVSIHTFNIDNGKPKRISFLKGVYKDTYFFDFESKNILVLKIPERGLTEEREVCCIPLEHDSTVKKEDRLFTHKKIFVKNESTKEEKDFRTNQIIPCSKENFFLALSQSILEIAGYDESIKNIDECGCCYGSPIYYKVPTLGMYNIENKKLTTFNEITFPILNMNFDKKTGLLMLQPADDKVKMFQSIATDDTIVLKELFEYKIKNDISKIVSGSRLLVVGCNNGHIILYDPLNKKEKIIDIGKNQKIDQLAISPHNILVAVSSDNELHVFDIHDKENIKKIPLYAKEQYSNKFIDATMKHTDTITSILFNKESNGNYNLVSSDKGGVIRVWNVPFLISNFKKLLKNSLFYKNSFEDVGFEFKDNN